MAPRTKRLDCDATATALHAAYAQRAAAAGAGSDNDWRRDHLGASVLGHKCDRYLWQTFRWVGQKPFDGRMLRLLERGKREESWLVDDLRRLGIQVWDHDPETGEQWRVRWGHVGGGCDFVLLGILEAPDVPHLGELKTSNAKQFERLKEKGVKQAKPEHYVQMQVYMHGLGLTFALYLCVCKDNDQLYTERVAYDQAFAEAAIERGQRIVAMPEPPPRQLDRDFPPCMLTSKDGTQWPCSFFDQCWKGGIPAKNCRTCVSCDVLDDEVRCVIYGKSLDGDAQRAGCSSHLSIPAVVGHQVVSVEGRTIVYQAADGAVVRDGA
jgi:hypothetical protein